MPQFEGFPKIARLNRDMVVTEKIDGTNAAIGINGEEIWAQSRKRLITPEDDNFGFAAWVQKNAYALRLILGDGLHFGEYWGLGSSEAMDLRRVRSALAFSTATAGETQTCPLSTVLASFPSSMKDPSTRSLLTQSCVISLEMVLGPLPNLRTPKALSSSTKQGTTYSRRQ